MVPVSKKLKQFNEQMDLFKNKFESNSDVNDKDYKNSVNSLLDIFLELDHEDQCVVFFTYINTSRLVNVLVRDDIREVLNHLKGIEAYETTLESSVKKEFHDLERLNQMEMIRLKIFLVKFFAVAIFLLIAMTVTIIGLVGDWCLFEHLLNPVTEFFKVVGLVFKQ